MTNSTLLISIGIIIATFTIVGFVQGWMPSGPEPTPAQTSGPERTNAQAFSLTDIETGESITLETYEDETLLIHVFASWCGLCTTSARSIAGTDESMNVLLVAADERETDAQLLAFKERNGHPTWRVARLTPEFEASYGIRALDSKFLIERGTIIHADRAMWNAQDARRIIGGAV